MSNDDATAAAPETRRGRTGGRSGRQAARLAAHVEASPFLTRTLKHAELKRNEGGISDALVKALLAGELDAYAGNRMRLHAAAQKTPGLRIVADNFYGVEQAIIVPKGNAAALALVNKLIDEARASGLIAEAIARAGLVGVDVAPPNTR